MANVTMPQLGFDMQEGTLVRWLKQPGDTIERGEAIAEIETDKAVIEIESFEAGTLKKLLIDEGTTVPVGEPIAVIDTGADDDESTDTVATSEKVAVPDGLPAVGEDAPSEVHPTREGQLAQAAVDEDAAAQQAARPGAAAVGAPGAVSTGTGRIKASPIARRLAAEHGIDLPSLSGSGPGGRIVKQDVLTALESAPAVRPAASAVAAAMPAAEDEVMPLSRMRQTIARRMTESKQQAPHFYVTMAIDMGKAMELRASLKELGDGEARVSVNDLVMKATAIALQREPSLNSSFEGDAIRTHGAVHLAMAVALAEGLITPVIRDCHAKSLLQIAQEARELAEAARTGGLRPDQYQGGTFTISNLGMFGVEEFSAIINPPQGAILAVSAVREEPVVRNGELAVGRIMRVTVSADHRVTDGAQVARFLQELKDVLENPLRLLV